MKKIISLSVVLICFTATGLACPFCNKQIMDRIYNSQFYPNLLTMLSAFIVLAIITAILTAMTVRRHKARLAGNPDMQVLSRVPLTSAAIVLGIGMGGFIDGIVLHQILQVHEMLSNKVPATEYIGKSVNMFWDGVFHFFCMVVLLIGIILMWKLLFRKDVDRSGKLFWGGLLLGWGLFNIVEGVIDHQILKLHNVIEFSPNHDIGNFAFLAVSLVMLIIGSLLVSSENKNRYRSTGVR